MPALTALAAAMAYLWTLSPSISWTPGVSDSGELAAAAYVLGVPHPTGYPLYMLLGWAATHLLADEPAHALNLFSAACGALATGLVAALTGALCIPRGGEAAGHGGGQPGRGWALGSWAVSSAWGGITFAAVPAFWLQATNTETRALAAALVVAVVLALAGYLATRTAPRLVLAWAVLGLALADHLLCLAVVPAVLATTVIVRLPPSGQGSRTLAARALAVPRAAAALLPGLALYAYLPLRAAARPALNWGDPRTVRRFLWSITGAQYRPLMGLDPTAVPGRLLDRAEVLADSMAPLAGGAGIAGLVLLCWWRPRLGSLLVLTILTGFLQSALYGATSAPDYLIPCQAILAACAGFLFWTILTACARGAGRAAYLERMAWRGLAILAVAAAAAGMVQEASSQGASAAQQDSADTRSYALATLAGLPRHALIVTDDDTHTFPLWYAQFALHVRPDVAVVNTHLLSWPWAAVTLRAHYSWLRWDGAPWPAEDTSGPPAGEADPAIAREEALLRANLGRVSIFYTFPAGVALRYCGFALQDNLFRCVPLRLPGRGRRAVSAGAAGAPKGPWPPRARLFVASALGGQAAFKGRSG